MVTQQVAQKQRSQPDPMAELPVGRWTQGVHDEPGKKFEFALFCLFLLEMSWNFE